jgi:hypothetical protein
MSQLNNWNSIEHFYLVVKGKNCFLRGEFTDVLGMFETESEAREFREDYSLLLDVPIDDIDVLYNSWLMQKAGS